MACGRDIGTAYKSRGKERTGEGGREKEREEREREK